MDESESEEGGGNLEGRSADGSAQRAGEVIEISIVYYKARLWYPYVVFTQEGKKNNMAGKAGKSAE